MRDGPPAGARAGSHLLPSVRGDLLGQVDRRPEAAALTRNESEQALLLRRAKECG